MGVAWIGILADRRSQVKTSSEESVIRTGGPARGYRNSCSANGFAAIGVDVDHIRDLSDCGLYEESARRQSHLE
jgi:hypothetical protein